uniref:Protein kinase domain-containing protein n=1 Tax=Manihot esculenta TaxID=3983 RepID=A0A2C9U2L0_MANES
MSCHNKTELHGKNLTNEKYGPAREKKDPNTLNTRVIIKRLALPSTRLVCFDNHGVAWWRGRLLGKGGCGSVYLASLKPESSNAFYPPHMAVKSAEFSLSRSLRKEKEVFYHLRDCPYILECYGEKIIVNNKGQMVYNLLLEYASGGTLFDPIRRSGDLRLPESDVKRYTRSILKGIDYIHSHEYVHCDLKPENVLLVRSGSGDFVPKIVYEMFTGKPLWGLNLAESTEELRERIADRFELPEIPQGISEDGKDFLKGCLVKNHKLRFTIKQLLNHPFVSGIDDKKSTSLLGYNCFGMKLLCPLSASLAFIGLCMLCLWSACGFRQLLCFTEFSR